MRRSFLIGCAGLLLCSACARQSPLPSDEVLRRSAAASDRLQSAAFTVKADVASAGVTGVMDAHVEVAGVLLNGGRQSQFSVIAQGSIPAVHQPQEFILRADGVAEWQREFFFRMQEARVQPPNPLLPDTVLRQMQGIWWRVPSSASPSSMSVTTDPRLLNAQAQIVRVIEDRGVQRIHGRNAYRYDVTIDPERLLDYLQRIAETNGDAFDRGTMSQALAGYTATGELWIDAETFTVHRISWNIKRADGMTLALQADLAEHDQAKTILVPQNAREFPRGGLLDVIVSGTGSFEGGASLLPPLEGEEGTVLDVFRSEQQPAGSGETMPLLPIESGDFPQ